jgi:hypothetical protein
MLQPDIILLNNLSRPKTLQNANRYLDVKPAVAKECLLLPC